MISPDIKKDFPIFQAESGKEPFVFLDSAAVSQMPGPVIDAVGEYYRSYKANIHSGIYSIGVRAVEAYEQARAHVADFIGAAAEEIIFTSGTTASLNMLSRMVEPQVQKGDEILVSAMEHHSNFIPWQELARRTGAVFTVVPLEDDGTLSLDTVRRNISEKTKIVAVTHVSHAIGAVNNVREIAQMARAAGAFMVVDAAQSVPHMRISVRDIDCDFLAFSGQKIMGPTGIGVLYGKRAHLDALPPAVFGGGMIRDVNADASTWADTPAKFEAGTPHVAGAIGLCRALMYADHVGMAEVQRHEHALASSVATALAAMPEVTVYGPNNRSTMAGIVSFNVKDAHPHDVAEILAQENIAVRAGHHCALPLMKHLKISGTVRASFYVYNTQDDVDRLIAGIQKSITTLRR